MIQVFSVCKTIYGEKEPLDDKRLTHGYCPECFEIAMAEIENNSNLTALKSAESPEISHNQECAKPRITACHQKTSV